MLNIRRRGIPNSILLEDVPFVISAFIVLVDLEDIFSTSWLVLDYFSHSVIELLSDWFYWYWRSCTWKCDSSYWSTSLIGDLKD